MSCTLLPFAPLPRVECGRWNRVKAKKYLNFAIEGFGEMKMQYSLERVLRHKEILGT